MKHLEMLQLFHQIQKLTPTAHFVLCKGKVPVASAWQEPHNAPLPEDLTKHLLHGSLDAKVGVIPASLVNDGMHHGLICMDQDRIADSDPWVDITSRPVVSHCSSQAGRMHHWFIAGPDLPAGNAKWTLGDVRYKNGFVILWDPKALLEAISDPGKTLMLTAHDYGSLVQSAPMDTAITPVPLAELDKDRVAVCRKFWRLVAGVYQTAYNQKGWATARCVLHDDNNPSAGYSVDGGFICHAGECKPTSSLEQFCLQAEEKGVTLPAKALELVAKPVGGKGAVPPAAKWINACKEYCALPDKHFIHQDNPQVKILSERVNDHEAFRDIPKDDKGKMLFRPDKWISENRQIVEVIHRSSMPWGYIHKSPMGTFNAAKQWAQPEGGDVEKGKELILPFLQEVFSDEAEEGETSDLQQVLAWTSYILNYPSEPPRVALVLCGDQGTGKTTFTEVLRAILGNHADSASMQSIGSQFNPWIDKRLIIIPEIASGRGAQKNLMDDLKDIIAGEKTQVMNRKYGIPITVDVRAAVIACTNHHATMPTEGTDRRLDFILTRSASGQERKRGEICGRVHKEIALKCSVAHICAYLMSYPCPTMGDGLVARETAVKRKIKENGLDSLGTAGGVVKSLLGEGRLWVTARQVINRVIRTMFENGVRPSGTMNRDINRALDEAGYRKYPNPADQSGRWKSGRMRYTVYKHRSSIAKPSTTDHIKGIRGVGEDPKDTVEFPVSITWRELEEEARRRSRLV